MLTRLSRILVSLAALLVLFGISGGQSAANAATLAEQVRGRILLQVEKNGEAWYVYPKTQTRFFLSRPADAFTMMRQKGLGITTAKLNKIPRAGTNDTGDATLQKKLSGYILLQVEDKGQAWYVHPKDLHRYSLGRPADAFTVMRQLGLGISNSKLAQITKDADSISDSFVNWDWDGSEWNPKGNPPGCASPFTVRSPVDLNLVTHILYPGQYRTLYKPHGGFRLDGTAYDAVTITAPFDAYVVDGSRYYEDGMVQYLFDFVTSCGIRYRLDHLHTLSSTMAALADLLPAPGGSSATTNFTSPKLIKAGATIATAVGHPDNVGFDWGLYDFRQQNNASTDASYRSEHASESSNAFYGVCWFDWLSAGDEATVRALPPGDGVNGSTSDYCE